jgi:hypothetical protein
MAHTHRRPLATWLAATAVLLAQLALARAASAQAAGQQAQSCNELINTANSFVVTYDESRDRLVYPSHTPLDGERLYLCVDSTDPWNRYGLTMGARQSGDATTNIEQKFTIGLVASDSTTTQLRVTAAVVNAEGACARLSEPQQTRCRTLREELHSILNVHRNMVTFRDSLAQMLTDISTRPLDGDARAAARLVAEALQLHQPPCAAGATRNTLPLFCLPQWNPARTQFERPSACDARAGQRPEATPTRYTIETLVNLLLPDTIHWADGQWHFLSEREDPRSIAQTVAAEIVRVLPTPRPDVAQLTATITTALASARALLPDVRLPTADEIIQQLPQPQPASTQPSREQPRPASTTARRDGSAEVIEAVQRAIAAQLSSAAEGERVVARLEAERTALLDVVRALMQNYSTLAVVAARVASAPPPHPQIFALGSFGANTVVQATLLRHRFGARFGPARDQLVYEATSRQYALSLTVHGTSYFQVQSGAALSLLPSRTFRIEPSTTAGQGTIRVSDPFTFTPTVFVNLLWCAQDVGAHHWARRCRGRVDSTWWRSLPTVSVGVPLSEQLFAPSAFVGVSLPYIPYVSLIVGAHFSMLPTLRSGFAPNQTTTETDTRNLTEPVPHAHAFFAIALNTELIAALQTAARPAQ